MGANVSIIVLSYNPNLISLKRTIRSAIFQKNIDFEIIVSDDCSKNNFHKEIEQLFIDNGFYNYKINKNNCNVGTVKNILSALKLAKGEYVYCISQGDMLFDDNTISDFYHFSKNKSAKICFGDYLGYNCMDDKVNIFDAKIYPRITGAYSKGFKIYKNTFLLNDYILGPSYFRERSFFEKALTQISKTSVYVEDSTTTAYALTMGVEVYYYPRKIVWYEIGIGISQGANSKLMKQVDIDILKTLDSLVEKYPKDRTLKAGRDIRLQINRNSSIFSLIIKYPFLFVKRFCYRKILKNRDIRYTKEDRNLLLSKIY